MDAAVNSILAGSLLARELGVFKPWVFFGFDLAFTETNLLQPDSALGIDGHISFPPKYVLNPTADFRDPGRRMQSSKKYVCVYIYIYEFHEVAG